MTPVLPEPSELLDFTPDTTVILYMRKQNLNWHIVLKELLDNAIEWGATQIRLTLTRHRVRIEDNGLGCADMRRMIRLGEHVAHEGTQIGQYGVGAKDAFVWSANRLAIASTCQGVRRSVSVDWNKILQRHIWRLDQRIVEEATTEPSGTRIELSELWHPRFPTKERIEDDIGSTYMPALRAGCQILLKYPADSDFVPVKPFSFPPLDLEQREIITIDGKTADVTLGILPPGTPMAYRGLMCFVGPRAIMQQKRLGIPPEVLPEIFGHITFEPRRWTLEKNKTDILDNLDPLAAEIERRFQAVFLEAAQRKKARPGAQAVARVNASLQHYPPVRMENRKELRNGPHTQEGSVTPKHTGGRRTPKEGKDQPGDQGRKPRHYTVQLTSLGVEEPLGRVNEDVILINQDIPSIQQALDHERLLEVEIRWTAAYLLGTLHEGNQLKLWRVPGGVKEQIEDAYKRLCGMNLKIRHSKTPPAKEEVPA